MKLIIDIPEDTYKRIKGLVDADYFEHDINGFSQKAIANGTPIPDNATNGDMIKAIFPNTDIEIHNITVYVMFDMHSNVIPFDLDWWNSLYQKGGKE